MRYRLLFALCASLLLGFTLSCSKPEKELPDEDYEKLFPFGGIDKPRISYDEQNLLHCDPQLTKAQFRYPGVEITENVREYTVTLTCSFDEASRGGDVTSKFVVKYVGADKALHLVASHPNTPDADAQMTQGTPYTVTFKVSSGFPMYLAVDGRSHRGASVKARLSAQCTDGYTVVKTLETEQHQNAEGINPLPAPYCNYLILP